jgi:3-hydroxyisobutyrate dehydrogenase-like beta-hydroxyacid dehydrogenase
MENVSPTLAVLGLGIIGGTWAAHYEAAGLLRASWNRTPHSSVPRRVESPEEAAKLANTLHVCVADPAAVESVLLAALPEIGPQHLIIQSSTIDPASGERFAALLATRGAAYVEAPFTGSKPAAEARKLVFYLGGNTAAKARAEQVLAQISDARVDCGEVRHSASLKLAMNLNLAIMMESLSESLAFARRSGLSDDLFFNALSRNVGHSGLVKLKEEKLRQANYATQFSVKHMLKDVRLALGTREGADLAALTAARDRLAEAAASGHGDLDFSVLLKLLGTDHS